MLTFVGNAFHTGSYQGSYFTRPARLYVQNRTDSLIGWYEYEDGGVYGGADSSERSFAIGLRLGHPQDSAVARLVYDQDSIGKEYSWPIRLTKSQAFTLNDTRTITYTEVALDFSTIYFEDGCAICPPGGSSGMILNMTK